ncbi:MAG: hypothetical protein H6719_18180 [Sandaracinaceae bacterium]|nr:hypothetical protein [Sandaracinaceae bacterium]
MKILRTALWIGVLMTTACGGEASEPAPTAASTAAPAASAELAVTCDDYEAQMEACSVRCTEFCGGPTPGSACASCQSECADQIFCERCGDTEACSGEE